MLIIGSLTPAAFSRMSAMFRNCASLSILDVLHRKVLDKGTSAKSQLFKYLPDNIFGYLTTFIGHLSGNFRSTHRHPEYILVLGQSGNSRSYDEVEDLELLGMTRQKALPSTTATAYPSRFRSISGLDFIYGIVHCCFAHTEKFCNFVHATSAKSKSLGSEILSSSVFVELGHKQLFFEL